MEVYTTPTGQHAFQTNESHWNGDTREVEWVSYVRLPAGYFQQLSELASE